MAKTVLIVDEEQNVVIPLEFLLERHGYHVQVAYSGEEAIESIINHKPDLILLDIMLPGIDGFEVCEIVRLKPEWRDIKIVFLTARDRDIDILKGMVLGADVYITKPFSKKEVVDNIESLLGTGNCP